MLCTVHTNRTNGPRGLASYEYDAEKRRSFKSSSPGGTRYFTYSGWSLLCETLTTDHFPLTTYFVWGRDLSGTLDGAGGVFAMHNAQCIMHNSPDSCEGQPRPHSLCIVHYELCIDGPARPASFFILHSAFCIDAGLYYYGYRYYSPELGRWITRDPIEEEGGDNLYAFCGNNGVNKVDPMGNTSDAFGIGMGLGFRIGFNSMGRPMYALMLMASAQQGLCDRLRFKTDIGIRFFRGGAMGTPRNSSSWFYETYYSVSGSIGGGKRRPTPYFINGLQWGSLLGDTYGSSFSAGQTFYYNSSLRESTVRMGLLRFQSSGFFMNYNNDQRHFPYGLGDGGDRGWTGGGALGFSVGDGNFAVAGFDDFSGRADDTIPYSPNAPNRQSEYSTSLNQAQWTLGVADGIGRSLGVSIDAPDMFNVQHWIHSTISKEAGYFDYPDDIMLNFHATGVIVPIKQ